MNIHNIRTTDIQIGEHHRKDHGDLEAHAKCIETEGLLKPIGVTPDNQLIWGHRTLLAYRDILGRETIPANVIDVPSIAHGRFIEWAYSKELAPSEMVALIEAVRSFEHGGDRRSDQARKSGDVSTKEACKRVGISDDTFYRAKQVCDEGSPELKEAMDKRLVSINQAHKLLKLPANIVQECVERLPSSTAAERRAVTKTAKRIERERRKQELLSRPILIPSSDEMIQLHHCRFQGLAEVTGLTRPSDLVIDPCGGGFTTAIACLRHFRRFVGCDVQQQWVANGQERVDKTRAELIKELEIYLTDVHSLGRPMTAAKLLNDWAAFENVSPFVAKQIVNQLPDDVRELLDNDSASAA